MNIWHDIEPSKIKSDSFFAVVEISKDSKMKYELDKKTGMLKLDRILHTATRYPANYGFIPRTFAEDNDPLDVLIVCNEVILPLTLVKCNPIGVINMVDGGENDYKILAVLEDDPVYNSVKDYKELPEHIFKEMCHFFTVYKDLEGKKTFVSGMGGANKAKEIISSSMDAYNAKFSNY